MCRNHNIIRCCSFSLNHNMFKLHTMSSNNQTHHSSRWLNRSFSKEGSEEDSKAKEDSVEEEDEVKTKSNVITMEYLGTIKGISLMRSVHTMQPAIIMSKISLS